MDQHPHIFPFALERIMSKPWPTRAPCQRRAPATTWPDMPLLDELARLSQSNSGWILFIAPPGLPTATYLQEQGINPQRVLVVHHPKIKNWQQTLERSLSCGHCTAVLAWLPGQMKLDQRNLALLGQRTGTLTRFFTHPAHAPSQPASPDTAVAYAEQDIYLNH